MSSAWKVKDRGRILALNTVCSRKSVAAGQVQMLRQHCS
jgi:hypothetical protein